MASSENTIRASLGMFDRFQGYAGRSIEDVINDARDSRDSMMRVIETQTDFIEQLEKHRDNIQHILDAKKAYFTQAWDESVKSYRDNERLPTHNINIFAPEIDGIVGIERNARRDIKLYPVEGDDEQTAELLNLYLRYLSTTSRDSFRELDIYKTGLICGRAHQELYWDFTDDPFGELKCRNVRPEDVLVDINATDVIGGFQETDISIRFHMEWMHPREIKRLYGENTKVDWTGLNYGDPSDHHHRNTPLREGVDDRYDYPADRYKSYFWMKEKNWVRLIRCWKKNYKTIYRVVDTNPESDPNTAFIGDFDTVSEANKAQVKISLEGGDISGMQTQQVKVPYWSYQVMSGRVELAYVEDIGRYSPWVDFFAIEVDGTYHGLWNRVQDRQKWVNYIMSKLSERMGRLGAMPSVWRENSLVHNINVSAALRDGEPIVVKEEVWDKLLGQKPFDIIEDKSLSSIGPLIDLAQDIRQDIKVAIGQGDVQKGLNPPGVTAASALAILQQEGSKITSGYAQNLHLMRADKAMLRLWMLYQQYKATPGLMVHKLGRIFGSMVMDEANKDAVKVLAEKFMEGTFDLDSMISNIPMVKYDVQLSTDPETLLEKQQIISELQLLQGFGVQISPKHWIKLLPSVPQNIKRDLIEGFEQQQQEIDQMLQTPEGQMKLAMQSGQKMPMPKQNEQDLLKPLSDQGIAQEAVAVGGE